MPNTDDLARFARGDDRIVQLINWVSGVLDGNISSIDFASADASFRRYFRIVHDNVPYIVMDAPPEHLKIETFINISKRFLQFGLNVPEIFEWSKCEGFALITDFGNTTYLNILNHANADNLYEDAIDSLINLQLATDSDPDFLPPYDSSLLNREMNLFRDWYLPEHRNMTVTNKISDVLDYNFEILTNKALEQPKVWVHLDYHSRNLMYLEKGNPGILDFQDAVHGPITYDLMSLLRDCYIVWPDEKIQQWIDLYLKKASQAGLVNGIDAKQFVEWFDWMGIQRHVKVAGIFSRLFYRDGKSQYLDDIPTVMNYLESVSGKYRELDSLHKLVLKLKS